MQKSAAPLTAAILAKKGFAAPAVSAAGVTGALFGTPSAECGMRPLKLRVPGDAPLPPHGEGAGRDAAFSGDMPSRSRRVTVRMDADHYLRARIAAVHLGTSVQRLVLAAIDAYLLEVGLVACDAGCTCLAQEVAASAAAAGTGGDP